ncbi:MAG: hypothetical protein K6G11_03890 [Lachnospiraceae bacterium]|nr:hypothetical protein [Lachnospiraceae bacterium]
MKKSFKKSLVIVLIASLVLGTFAAPVKKAEAFAICAADTAPCTTVKRSGYRAFLSFQCAERMLFRDSWYDGQTIAGEDNSAVNLKAGDVKAGYGIEAQKITVCHTVPGYTSAEDITFNETIAYSPIFNIGLTGDVTKTDETTNVTSVLLRGGAFNATFTDAYMDHAGTYSVKMELPADQANLFNITEYKYPSTDASGNYVAGSNNTNNIFNILGITTDIPRALAPTFSDMKLYIDDKLVYKIDGELTVENGGIKDDPAAAATAVKKTSGNYYSAMLLNTYDSHKSASLVNCLDDNGQATRDTTKFDAKPTKSLELVFTLSGDIFDADNTEPSDSYVRFTEGKKYVAFLNPDYKYFTNKGVTLDADGNIKNSIVIDETETTIPEETETTTPDETAKNEAIKLIIVSIPYAVEGLVYDGNSKNGIYENDAYDVDNGSAIHAGIYTAVVSLKDKSKYCWEDGTTEDKTVSWKIAPKKIAIPVAVSNLVYDGTEKTGVASTEYYVVTNGSSIKAGDYTAKVILYNKTDYVWEDGTTTDKTVKWSISEASTSNNSNSSSNGNTGTNVGTNTGTNTGTNVGTNTGTNTGTTNNNSSNSNDDSDDVTVEKISIRKLKALKGKKVKVIYSTDDDATGYQVNYALNKTFSMANKYKTTYKSSCLIKKLKKGKRYYIRVRAYAYTFDGKVYGAWSKAISVKVK